MKMKQPQDFRNTYQTNKPFTIKGSDGKPLQCTGFQLGAYYTKGGNSWFTGAYFKGGFYTTFTPLTEVRQENGYWTYQTELGTGFRDLHHEADRFSKKQLDLIKTELESDIAKYLNDHLLSELNSIGFKQVR